MFYTCKPLGICRQFWGLHLSEYFLIVITIVENILC